MGERGVGLSIFKQTQSWDSENRPLRIVDQLRFYQKLIDNFSLSPATSAELKAHFDELASELLIWILGRVRREPKQSFRALTKLTVRVPRFWRRAPFLIWQLPAYRRSILAQANAPLVEL